MSRGFWYGLLVALWALDMALLATLQHMPALIAGALLPNCVVLEPMRRRATPAEHAELWCAAAYACWAGYVFTLSWTLSRRDALSSAVVFAHVAILGAWWLERRGE